MSERRVCDGCGKDYWWPNARWQHEGCVLRSADTKSGVEPVSGERADREVDPGRKQRWSREAYNAYQREYMRKRRAK